MFDIENPKNDIQWRNLILFGRNTATYKFAFGKTLLDFAAKEKNMITLDDLAEPFSNYLIEHIKKGANQGNNGKFISALENYINGNIHKEEMLNVTKYEGFKNVIDAFQNINNGTIPNKFYDGKFNGKNTKLTLTDELLSLS